MIYARRTDNNQRAILGALKELGCTHMDLSRAGSGVMDAIISAGGPSLPIEIKNPAGRNRIERAQAKAFSEYSGSIRLVRSLDDVEETAAVARFWRDCINIGIKNKLAEGK